MPVGANSLSFIYFLSRYPYIKFYTAQNPGWGGKVRKPRALPLTPKPDQSFETSCLGINGLILHLSYVKKFREKFECVDILVSKEEVEERKSDPLQRSKINLNLLSTKT